MQLVISMSLEILWMRKVIVMLPNGTEVYIANLVLITSRYTRIIPSMAFARMAVEIFMLPVTLQMVTDLPMLLSIVLCRQAEYMFFWELHLPIVEIQVLSVPVSITERFRIPMHGVMVLLLLTLLPSVPERITLQLLMQAG